MTLPGRVTGSPRTGFPSAGEFGTMGPGRPVGCATGASRSLLDFSIGTR